MTVGELLDMFEDKLRTGEINRLDSLRVCGKDSEASDWVHVLDVRAGGYNHAVIDINAHFEGEF